MQLLKRSRTSHTRLRRPEGEGAPAWAQSVGSATSTKTELASPRKNSTRRPKERGGRNQWCSFHNSTTHSDADCRTQHGVSTANAGDANYAASHYIDHTVSFTTVEVPTEEEMFWSFGPTDEPIDTSGMFGPFGGVSGEVTDDSLFMVVEEPAQELGFREHIVDGLTAMTRALVIVAILHYL